MSILWIIWAEGVLGLHEKIRFYVFVETDFYFNNDEYC